MWVVRALDILFTASFGRHLVFKGGTSLSKAYDVIARFSEDVDLTYDIRAIAPDLAEAQREPIPANPSQEQKWTKIIRARLDEWTKQTAAPALETRLTDSSDAKVGVDGSTVTITYEPLTKGTGYVSPVVLLEFGARSTGEPSEPRHVMCDAAPHVPQVAFPSATPVTMRPERTFWEKATAIHVFCLGGKLRGDDRVSRHWHDIVALDQAGHVTAAIADRELAEQVARHKNAFFREKDARDVYIDYERAVGGDLRLVPEGDRLTLLARDYQRMASDGLLFSTPPAFSALIDHCRDIERRVRDAGPV